MCFHMPVHNLIFKYIFFHFPSVQKKLYLGYLTFNNDHIQTYMCIGKYTHMNVLPRKLDTYT